ncbi:MAG TPA: hypothetical protein VGG70_12555 [Candidatus Cybelea sp.]
MATSGAVPRRPAPTQPPVVATPAVTPAPAATASPSAPPAANRASAALPPPPKRVPRAAPDAAPQILDVAVSETSVHPGDRVFGRVVTSSNVASVEARIGGYGVSLAKVGVGRFELTYTVGPLPWFVRGNFTMQLTARNTRGDTATRAIPLTVRQ